MEIEYTPKEVKITMIVRESARWLSYIMVFILVYQGASLSQVILMAFGCIAFGSSDQRIRNILNGSRHYFPAPSTAP